jgi:hypothetical protein
MFGPKTISVGSQPRSAAPARRADAISSSVSSLVAKAPPELALLARR